MEPASPARLYATAAGALLLILGVVGFFYGSSFGSPGTLDHTLGVLRTNGWLNLLWAALGALGLLLAGTASRAYALGAGLLLTALGVWGLALDPTAAILGFLPASGANEALNLTLGVLGLLAAAGTPRRIPSPPPHNVVPKKEPVPARLARALSSPSPRTCPAAAARTGRAPRSPPRQR